MPPHRTNRSNRTTRTRNCRGQALLPVVLWGVAAMVSIALVTRWAVEAAHASRAQAAADATALGVAQHGSAGRSVAGDAAVSVHRSGATVSVRAVIGDQSAWASAIAETRVTQRRIGLAPSMVAAVARAEQLLGSPLQIVSGYRSPDHQQRLWDERHSNPYPVAEPGTSLHERGLAIDVALSQVGALQLVAASAGLCYPLPESDPVHFVACPIPE